MKQSKKELWQRFQKNCSEYRETRLAIDVSRIDFPDGFFESVEPRIQKAFEAMDKLEKGEIANPDENRTVGRYWLHNSALAPSQEIRNEIDQTIQSIKQFTSSIHRGEIVGKAGLFKKLLLIGIDGSVFEPQFVSNAPSQPTTHKLKIYFLITDQDGMECVLAAVGDDSIFFAGNGKGLKGMAVLPYMDSIELVSGYSQQLLMESLSKELDLFGMVLNQ